VLAYDTEYAMVDRDDDLKIGMKTSAITLGRFDVAAVMAFYVRLPADLDRALVERLAASWAWFLALMAAALAQIVVALHASSASARREGCFTAFRANHWLGSRCFEPLLANQLTGAGRESGSPPPDGGGVALEL
jgi:4-hydroxybenzoate polyprenyltransferase